MDTLANSEDPDEIWHFIRFVWFDSLHPSQQFFNHVRKGLPGLNQSQPVDSVSCSRT